jgi:uncharacterized UBP type Zn finger protein
MLYIQECKPHSKVEQQEPDQEDEAPQEYALTAVISHIGVKTDSRDYMAFCKIEERRWRFYGTECAHAEESEVFSDNFPENDSVETAALLMHATTTREEELEQ